jgi:hypothetical protein
MKRTIVVEGVSFTLVPAMGREDQWLVHYGGGPIGVLRRVAGIIEAVLPTDASKESRELMGRVRDAVEADGTLDEITKA